MSNEFIQEKIKELEAMSERRKLRMEAADRLSMENDELIAEFNSLPWYKKIGKEKALKMHILESWEKLRIQDSLPPKN